VAQGTGTPARTSEDPKDPFVSPKQAAGLDAEKVPAGVQPVQAAKVETTQDAKAALDRWVRCSGLHTVNDWVVNYRKHPAGWGALLMIHGVQEVTNRLRQKVQNYAVFSALFLAGSIKAMSSPIPVCRPDPDTWECHIRKRVYSYFFALTIASHILCILLAMAFHNALNEAARDSDVYRMFARGQGFKATRTCQSAFRAGACACCVALTAVAQEFVGWDMVAWAALLAALVLYKYWQVSGRLFRNASIVQYWREELGGKPDADDPYDLDVPVTCFKSRVPSAQLFVRRPPPESQSGSDVMVSIQ